MSPAAPDSPSIDLPTSTHPRISAIKRLDLARAPSTLDLGQARAPARSYLPYETRYGGAARRTRARGRCRFGLWGWKTPGPGRARRTAPRRLRRLPHAAG